MLICLRDVPQSERHLLFCTDPRLEGLPRRRRHRARRRSRVNHRANAPTSTPISSSAIAHKDPAHARILVPLAADFDAAGMCSVGKA